MRRKLILLTSFILVLVLAGTNIVFGITVIERQVNKGSDDAEESVPAGGIDLSSSDLEMPYENELQVGQQIIGIRWEDIAIPRGSAVPLAWVQFDIDELKGGAEDVSLIIEGELSPDPVTFSTSGDISSRPRTAAQVVWNPPRWTETHVKDYTKNIASIIEEIVNQPAWKSGNALVLIISDNPVRPSKGLRCAESWDGAGPNTDQIPSLHIEFTNWSAMAPDPADGALYDNTSATLSWTPGETAVSHDVYFGENFADVNQGASSTFQGNQTETYFIVGSPGYAYPDGLVAAATYYWRVDEVEADGTTKHPGEVWSFSILSKTADNPDPPDGARLVPVDVTLSWMAGFGTTSHHVYFGENFADVNAGTGDTYKGPVIDPNYTPGTLAKDTTYYWRIDESDGVGTYKGDIWSFSTALDIPITDPSLLAWWKFDDGAGTTAIDSSGHNNYGTVNGATWVADGRIDGALDFNGTNAFVRAPHIPLNGRTFTITMWVKPVLYTDEQVVFSQTQSRSANLSMHFRLYGPGSGLVRMGFYSNDLNTSDNIIEENNWYHLTFWYDFENQNKRIYVNGIQEAEVTTGPFLGTSGDTFIGSWDGTGQWFRGLIDDVRIYKRALTVDEINEVMRGYPTRAWNPSPDNNSTVNVEEAKQQLLTWSPGKEAAEHDVYFGTDKLAVEGVDASDITGIYRGRQTATSYTVPEVLGWGSGPYYWRIDEYNTDATVSTGKVWNFTVANYLIVDDFEFYNDLDPTDPASNRIFNAWLDGYDNPANGSLVGYVLPPFCEQSIVHSGMQSMPLAYDNSGTVSYSEATLMLNQRDWTQEGVGILTVWFRGDSANTAARMYVTLNGTATAYHDNPDAALIDTWTEWNILLTGFSNQGVVLTNVNSIALGLGDRANPQSSGSGTMFFDDIRLYRLAP